MDLIKKLGERHVMEGAEMPTAMNNLTACYRQIGEYKYSGKNGYFPSLEAEALWALGAVCEVGNPEKGLAETVLLVKAAINKTVLDGAMQRMGRRMPASIAYGLDPSVNRLAEEINRALKGGYNTVPTVSVWQTTREADSGSGGDIGNGDGEIWYTAQAMVKTTDKVTGKVWYGTSLEGGYSAALAAMAADALRGGGVEAIMGAVHAWKQSGGEGGEEALRELVRSQAARYMDRRLAYAIDVTDMADGFDLRFTSDAMADVFPNGLPFLEYGQRDERFDSELGYVITSGNIPRELLLDDPERDGVVFLDPIAVTRVVDGSAALRGVALAELGKKFGIDLDGGGLEVAMLLLEKHMGRLNAGELLAVMSRIMTDTTGDDFMANMMTFARVCGATGSGKVLRTLLDRSEALTSMDRVKMMRTAALMDNEFNRAIFG